MARACSMLFAPLQSQRRIDRQVAGNLIRWSRRRVGWWVALVLPGLFLRALIPLGFMPAFGAHFGVGLTLCEGYAPVPVGMGMPMDMPMDMPMGKMATAPAGQHLHDAPFHQRHLTCPYGASPALAALAASTDPPAGLEPSRPFLIPASQVAHFTMAPRAQAPRAPPFDI